MIIHEYLTRIKSRLATAGEIWEFQIIRERETLEDGYLRVRLTLSDNSYLEFAEYISMKEDGEIVVLTYNYHWADQGDNLIRRWDNTPHFPNVEGFPHHIHEGKEDAVIPGTPINIFYVLDIISETINQ